MENDQIVQITIRLAMANGSTTAKINTTKDRKRDGKRGQALRMMKPSGHPPFLFGAGC